MEVTANKSSNNQRIIKDQLPPEVCERCVNIIELTPDFVGTTDEYGNVIYINPAGREMLGIPLDEDLSNTHIRNYHSKQTADNIINLALPFAIKHGTWLGNYPFLHRNGIEIMTSTVICSHFDKHHNLNGFSTISRNLTEQLEMEQQTILRSELANQSCLNTAAELAAGLAHEINQPLSAINNFAAGCLKRLDPKYTSPEIFESIRKIITQTKRASNIITNLKNFLFKKQMKHTIVDMNQLIRNLLKLIQHDLNNNAVLVELDLASALPFIKIDKTQIELVIINLLNNAIHALKATSNSDKLISISTSQLNDSFLQIAIKDNGSGISDHIVNKLFHPFVTTKETGMGIGLSLCQRIVEAHNGKLNLDFTDDNGTQFSIKLPC